MLETVVIRTQTVLQMFAVLFGSNRIAVSSLEFLACTCAFAKATYETILFAISIPLIALNDFFQFILGRYSDEPDQGIDQEGKWKFSLQRQILMQLVKLQ